MVDISLAVNRSFGGIRAATISASQATALRAAAATLDSILRQNNQSLTISVGNWNAILGSARGSVGVPEFSFESYRECLNTLRRCRLYDFASAFFKGRIRIAGTTDAIVDILYSINLRTDVPQSVEEKLFFFAFRKLKEWAPGFAKRFESDFHYSLDVGAYELFLDKYLQYTCGRVLPNTRSVDEAQVEKFKLIANWVGEHLGTLKNKRHLDIGCGWGGLISHFRDTYETDSIGLTNCAAQSNYISDRYGFLTIQDDFSYIGQLQDQFDFVTVIGMSEHVVGGLKDKLLNNIARCLKKEGVLYFQTIEKPDVWIGGDAYRIAQELVFPGHHLDSQKEAERRFDKAGFRIRSCRKPYEGLRIYDQRMGQKS